jgi:endoglucanase
MNRRRFLASTVAVSAGAAVSRVTAAPDGFVSVRGSQIVTPDGKELILKGIGLGNWLLPEGYMWKFNRAASPRMIEAVVSELIGPEDAVEFWRRFRDEYVTQVDIRLLKSLGFNSVRPAIDYRILSPEAHPEIWLDEGFKRIDRLVEWCREAGLWVILDMHGAPGGQTGENIDNGWGYPFLFTSERSQTRAIEVWRKLAERYRDEPAVLGYELLNEPIPNFDTYRALDSKLEPLFKRMTSAIREVDPNHIVILGGAQWNTDFSVFGEPFDDQLVYAFHRYWTKQNPAVIQPYLDFRDRYDVPIYMSESGENDNDWIRWFRELLETEKIGWSFWPYKKMDSTRGVVSFAPPEGWDQIVSFANREARGYKALQEARPPLDPAARTFDQLLKNILLENCTVNRDYIRALGLSAG